MDKLKEDRTELVVQLDEEKRKTEDLSFRLAESSIFKEDVEVSIINVSLSFELNITFLIHYKDILDISNNSSPEIIAIAKKL